MLKKLFKNKYITWSRRIKNFDYASDGYYFITICTKDRIEYFGKIINGKMYLNQLGQITYKYWQEIPKHFNFIIPDKFIIMPNHVHGIIHIDHDFGRALLCPTETRHCLVSSNIKTFAKSRFQNQGKGTISAIIGSYKSVCAKTIHQKFPKINFQWQSNYHESIIRGEQGLSKVRQYIRNNVIKWYRDRNNP